MHNAFTLRWVTRDCVVGTSLATVGGGTYSAYIFDYNIVCLSVCIFRCAKILFTFLTSHLTSLQVQEGADFLHRLGILT